MNILRNWFKTIVKHSVILSIDIYHYLNDFYDYYMRSHLKRLRKPIETDYLLCYLVFDKITKSQRLIRANEYTTILSDIEDTTRIVILSFTRNDIPATCDLIPPSTPRSNESDRLYCVLDHHTLRIYFKDNKPDLYKLRNSISEDIMYAGIKTNKTDYDIYAHFKKYMITGNRIDRFIIQQIITMYYPTYPTNGIFQIMNTNFETIQYNTAFSFVI